MEKAMEKEATGNTINGEVSVMPSCTLHTFMGLFHEKDTLYENLCHLSEL